MSAVKFILLFIGVIIAGFIMLYVNGRDDKKETDTDPLLGSSNKLEEN